MSKRQTGATDAQIKAAAKRAHEEFARDFPETLPKFEKSAKKWAEHLVPPDHVICADTDDHLTEETAAALGRVVHWITANSWGKPNPTVAVLADLDRLAALVG